MKIFISLSLKNWKDFPQNQEQDKQGMSLPPTYITSLQVPGSMKEAKTTSLPAKDSYWEEKTNLSVFADNKIMYPEMSKERVQKWLKLIINNSELLKYWIQ